MILKTSNDIGSRHMSDEHLYLAEAAKELGVGTSRLATLIRNGRVYPERPSSEKPYAVHSRRHRRKHE